MPVSQGPSTRRVRLALMVLAACLACFAGPATSGAQTVIEFDQLQFLPNLTPLSNQLMACGITFDGAAHFTLDTRFMEVGAGSDRFGISTTGGPGSAMTINFVDPIDGLPRPVENLTLQWLTLEGSHIQFEAHIAGSPFTCGEGFETTGPQAGGTQDMVGACGDLPLDSVTISNTVPGRVAVGQISFTSAVAIPCPVPPPPPPGPVLEIPTLSQWGMILLGLTLLAVATWQLAGRPALLEAPIAGRALVQGPSRGMLRSLAVGQGLTGLGLLLHEKLVEPVAAHDVIGAVLAGIVLGVLLECYRRGMTPRT